ncbi:hypothetical protein AN1V17_11650 [Vallitalea sediminicola]
MGKFNLNSLLSSSSINAIDKEDNKPNNLKIIPISVYDLIASKNNFYSVNEINSLKNSIEMYGLKQNLTVKELDNGKYRVIAGHRRCLASLALVEEGKTEFEMLPCAIETVDSIKEELLLITTNATTRQLSDWEKTQQAQRMRELLEEYRKQEKISGRTREIIAQVLETSPSQIGRMESISKHLTDEFTNEFKQDNINISTAYELSTLPKEYQQEVLEEFKDSGSLSINDVKEKKKELKEIKGTVKNNATKEQGEQEREKQEQEKKIENKQSSKELHSIPNQIFPTVYETIEEMNKQKLAQFICSRCDGTGFCDYITECNYCSIDERPKICKKWLDMQVQKNF